jgi:hypothetical protein
MSSVDKQIPKATLQLLLDHKKDILENISRHYCEELKDANADGERLFKYGFIFVGVVETTVGGLAVALQRTTGAVLFASALLFLSLAISAVLYERLRIEKAKLRQNVRAEREPIMQQIVMLKGFLEPTKDPN